MNNTCSKCGKIGVTWIDDSLKFIGIFCFNCLKKEFPETWQDIKNSTDKNEYLGCGNHSCLLEKPKGQGTCAGCQCLSSMRDTSNRLRVQKWIIRVNKYVKELEKENETLRKEIANLKNV